MGDDLTPIVFPSERSIFRELFPLRVFSSEGLEREDPEERAKGAPKGVEREVSEGGRTKGPRRGSNEGERRGSNDRSPKGVERGGSEGGRTRGSEGGRTKGPRRVEGGGASASVRGGLEGRAREFNFLTHFSICHSFLDIPLISCPKPRPRVRNAGGASVPAGRPFRRSEGARARREGTPRREDISGEGSLPRFSI